ncbi:hypothetical protein CBW65_12305 [Tumebacillus avium]|uniref:HIRAN domain-containing protein n=1 Tax=Tumebacillus avium TaxID=1903704 RepID=A0A1Y0IMH6_9BACL|nr:HIRAN domain-containing protein [Tumebacillus avium]ARU61718.1 hypothetical protein CBW65_12305 [Tumebacillus avium]
MKFTTPRLILMWSNPETKENCTIGVLTRNDHGYSFRYIQNEVKRAFSFGFTLLSGFPLLEKMYFSNKLFPVFERRIPSKGRRDYKEVIQTFSLSLFDDLDWEYLRVTKGELATDRFYFIEPIRLEDRYFKIDFKIAAWKFVDEQVRLHPGQELNFVLEPGNLYDTQAIQVFTNESHPRMVGYVPKPYNGPIYSWMNKQCEIKAVVRMVLEKQNYCPVLLVAGSLPQDTDQVKATSEFKELVLKVDRTTES